MSRSASLIGPTWVLIPLVAGVIFAVSAGLSNEHPDPVRRTTPSVRAEAAHLIPASKVVVATAAPFARKLPSHPDYGPGWGQNRGLQTMRKAYPAEIPHT